MFKSELKLYSEELHAPVRRRFPTRPVLVLGKNTTWCMDLNDMKTYKEANDGYTNIMVIEDLYTRKVWAFPLKDKKGETVLDDIKGLIKEVGKPHNIWTDRGGEFYNKEAMAYFKKNNIQLYSVYGQSKAAPVERVNQTLKHIMFKILTEQQSHRWLDLLDDVVEIYNNQIHSITKVAPEKAYENPKLLMEVKENEREKAEEKERIKVAQQIKHFQEMHEKQLMLKEKMRDFNKPQRPRKIILPETAANVASAAGFADVKKKLIPRYKIGDFVRISRIKGVFEKGYEINWTPEVFVITQIHFTDPITYNLNDLMGEEVDGSFYEQELQVTKLKDFSLVEKVLKKRKVKGKEQKFVKFFGWPSKFDQWLDAKDVADINP